MIYIKSLHIENYKCYENVDVEFNNSTNIIEIPWLILVNTNKL